jgi:hypothetical protein
MNSTTTNEQVYVAGRLRPVLPAVRLLQDKISETVGAPRRRWITGASCVQSRPKTDEGHDDEGRIDEGLAIAEPTFVAMITTFSLGCAWFPLEAQRLIVC